MAAKQVESDKASVHANGSAAKPAPEAVAAPVEAADETDAQGNNDLVGTVAIAGAIGVGAALIEASLIPGLIIGAVAVLAPKVVPGIGTRLRPLVKSTIRGAMKLTEKTREAFAEAHEHVQDIMAEARHEDQEIAAAVKAAPEATAAPKA
jgi:Protein of unknown function (DUF5132)